MIYFSLCSSRHPDMSLLIKQSYQLGTFFANMNLRGTNMASEMTCRAYRVIIIVLILPMCSSVFIYRGIETKIWLCIYFDHDSFLNEF